jgi:topoisomerase-4 subunit B
VAEAYGEAEIQVLEGLEPVRLRPGMYIGSTGPRGLHHLVYEIVDNAVDEHLAGHASRIQVWLDPAEVVTVEDDGRGIPTGMHPTGIPTPEVVFTKLHAGAKFGGGGYKVSGGLHGVGASVVNALSSFLEVEIRRDGRRHRQRYEQGKPVTGVEELGPTRQRGTVVRFQPDPAIFQTIHFEAEILTARLRELSFLNPGLSLEVTDRRGSEPETTPAAPPPTTTFQAPGGLADFVAYLNENHEVLHEPVRFDGKANGIEVAVAFQYFDGYAESVSSFVNCISTIEGGQHETGFRTAHTRVMNEVARKLGIWKKKDNLTGEDLREGLMAVLSLRMHHVEFEGQTKTKLGSVEARAAVEDVVGPHLAAWLDEHPEEATLILEKASRAAVAREAARSARQALRSGKKGGIRSSLDGKLTRCASRRVEENELVIVEGDSAGGSAKQGRDRVHQAILPLRGKPLNTERATIDKVLGNKEILSVVQAIGAGVGADFELDDALYGRILILADADDDGAHIRCLLLTFFYRFMRPLVTHGRIYVAQPPLYRIERKQKKKPESRYAWTGEELEAVLERWGRKACTVQRFKGLGEMNPDQLWETTLNPETRTLVRVTIEDMAMAERQVSVLMGDKADLRKRWIVDNVRFGEADAEAPESDLVADEPEEP